MAHFENINTLQVITVEEPERIKEFRELARWREIEDGNETTEPKPRKRGRPRKTDVEESPALVDAEELEPEE